MRFSLDYSQKKPYNEDGYSNILLCGRPNLPHRGVGDGNPLRPAFAYLVATIIIRQIINCKVNQHIFRASVCIDRDPFLMCIFQNRWLVLEIYAICTNRLFDFQKITTPVFAKNGRAKVHVFPLVNRNLKCDCPANPLLSAFASLNFGRNGLLQFFEKSLREKSKSG